jgi:hypothetical protein
MPEHYHRAPAWLRSRILRKITTALDVGHTPTAIAAYARKFAGDPAYGPYEHLRRFDDVTRKLTADVADGTTCPTCGRDPPPGARSNPREDSHHRLNRRNRPGGSISSTAPSMRWAPWPLVPGEHQQVTTDYRGLVDHRRPPRCSRKYLF